MNGLFAHFTPRVFRTSKNKAKTHKKQCWLSEKNRNNMDHTGRLQMISLQMNTGNKRQLCIKVCSSKTLQIVNCRHQYTVSRLRCIGFDVCFLSLLHATFTANKKGYLNFKSETAIFKKA